MLRFSSWVSSSSFSVYMWLSWRNVNYQRTVKRERDSEREGGRTEEEGENCFWEMWLKTETTTAIRNRTRHFPLRTLSLYLHPGLKVYIYTHDRRMLKHEEIAPGLPRWNRICRQKRINEVWSSRSSMVQSLSIPHDLILALCSSVYSSSSSFFRAWKEVSCMKRMSWNRIRYLTSS